jgi:SAM-dependent methyltransferase
MSGVSFSPMWGDDFKGPGRFSHAGESNAAWDKAPIVSLFRRCENSLFNRSVPEVSLPLRGNQFSFSERPSQVAAVSFSCFEALQRRSPYMIYTDTGKETYCFFNRQVDALRLANKLAKGKKKICVLDIGTGNGKFLESLGRSLESRVEAHGISAHDMRDKNSTILDRCYHIENAEDLSRFCNCRFDLICSENTFTHLVDPLAALEAAYNLLPQGGFLFINDLVLEGIDNIQHWVDLLNKNGYDVAAIPTLGAERRVVICSFAIRKTHPKFSDYITYSAQHPIVQDFAGRSRANYVFKDEEVQSRCCYTEEMVTKMCNDSTVKLRNWGFLQDVF